MTPLENLSAFYGRHGQDLHNDTEPFGVYRREAFACGTTPLPSGRRGFYKISLVQRGRGTFYLADRAIDINDNALTFTTPLVPYAWQPSASPQTGYFCVFTEAFIQPVLGGGSLGGSNLFKPGGDPVFFPDNERMLRLGELFENMVRETQSGYPHKNDVIRSYLQILLHEAVKMQPPGSFYVPQDAAGRISRLFLDLLAGQFPVEGPGEPPALKNAAEFAARLNVHPNTLNRALKEATGKTTTDWIAERLVREAKTLLLHGRWDVGEVGYALGFGHPSAFVTFFKKQTKQTPAQFRRGTVSISQRTV